MTFEAAVREYQPYDTTRVPSHHTRETFARIAKHAAAMNKSAYIYIDNRLEGCSPNTIEAVVDMLEPIVDGGDPH